MSLPIEKMNQGPVFVENPDGSLVQGVPPGYKEQTPPGTPRQQLVDPTFTTINSDIVRALARHETLFLSMLVLQLLVEIAFEAIHVSYREDAIFELSLIYPALSVTVIRVMYWLAFVGEVIYSIAFFGLGILAAFKSKPRLYQRFSTVALIGTLGQLPLAYLNRFNLLIFFLRFISYAYARFQWNLLHGIGLLREELIL
mmetsp:Transcript_67571/g.197758  ORF Transcript_67571/g.197758 Transcript_67571/m.197758 type:complete len:199 (-) Transcript_67571:92-688(-)